VAGFVSQPQNVGTITYVEYSYALNTGFPVAKMLNSAGYYTEPTAQNVAVALLKARIHSDLTQDLSGVYTDTDPRTYPLSSYSYMIIPTALQGSFTAAKGKTLGAFAYYFLCEGQQQAPILGYSPLPINLVQAGLSQVRRIPGVNVQSIDISKCHNPTFSSNGQNTLALHAPYPSPCDKYGVSQCATGTGGARRTSTPVSGTAPATSSNAAPTSNGVPTGTSVGTGTGLGGGGSSGQSANTTASSVSSQAMTLADTSAGGSTRTLLIWLGCAMLLATAIVPPIVSQRLRGRASK
ncbi:MAG: substrate-binding domain-containing protein, partial [Bacillota bacterium]